MLIHPNACMLFHNFMIKFGLEMNASVKKLQLNVTFV